MPTAATSSGPAGFYPLRVLLILVTGLGITAGIGVLMYFWIVSRLPMMTLLPGVIEAIVSALTLAWLYRRLNVRRVWIGLPIALLCGVVGATYCYYGFYIREVTRYVDDQKKEWQLFWPAGSKEYAQAIQPVTEHPLEQFDKALIYPRTHRHGFAGYVFAGGALRAALWVVQVFLTVLLAVSLGCFDPREASGQTNW